MAGRLRSPGGVTAPRGGWIVLALLGLLALPAIASAKPRAGDLDQSLGGNGVARTQLDGNNAVADSVAIGRKGKIVAFGSHSVGSGAPPDRLALVRYKPNSRLDRSFSGDGKVSTGFGKSDAYGHAVAIGKKGSIVVAGRVCRRSGPCSFGVAKYRSDGHLDSFFADDGKREVGFQGRMDSGANAVAIDSQGRVLLGGTSCEERRSGCDFALVRLDRAGNLDPSFGDGGQMIAQLKTESGEPVDSKASSMA